VTTSATVLDIHATDAPGNNSGNGSLDTVVKVGVCGPDPAPAGDVLQNMSPQLIMLISQLTGDGTAVPPELQTPFLCEYTSTVTDGAGTPVNDCPVRLPTEAPCSLSLDLNLDIPGGSPREAPTMQLNPIGVHFLPAALDWANDTEIPNGSPSGAAFFRIRTDAGLIPNRVPCQIDALFPATGGTEGAIEGNAPESNTNDALQNPNVWPNDMNAERALVESSFTTIPGGPAGVTLWSRMIVPLVIGDTRINMNVLTWKITDPVFQTATGANWVIVPFPGDVVNPDLPGTIGGNPDADDPPNPYVIPPRYCAPHRVILDFSGTAGGATLLSCILPGSHMAWNLVDPNALNHTGDEGPRSDTFNCSLDADGDGLSAGAETYWGTDPLNTDTDADGHNDLTDNCRVIANANQADYDGDKIGDICDNDVDGDGAVNASDLCPMTVVGADADAAGCSKAQVDMDADGWCDPNAPSTGPEPCIPTDNCPTIFNADQANADGDPYGDVCDGCTATATNWVVPANDSDCDGFDDATEAFIGTLGGQMCAATTTLKDEDPDSWPTDFNDDQLTAGADVLSFNMHFGHNSGDPEYSLRHDFSRDGLISGADLLRMNHFFAKRCA
jgi:hypothetical protein